MHVEVVERAWLLGVTVREGEVDGDGEADLAPAKNVLEERMPLFDLEVCQTKHMSSGQWSHLLISDLVLSMVFFELAKCE